MPDGNHSACSYDVIVVGAGSAGAALAARLTESGRLTVLLLEAGGPDRDTKLHVPAAFSQLFRSQHDWSYDTEPQEHLDGRRIYWPRGKVLGGSSSLNAMMWVRGFAADYDEWAELAGPQWSWEALRPLFLKAEHTMGSTDPTTAPPARSASSGSVTRGAHTAAFLKAARQAGYPLESANSLAPQGFTQTMVSQHRGARSSTATAYLKPVRRRRNVTVATGAHATRVLFDGRRATGVDYVKDGRTLTAHARRDVVLCGGAGNTPQLLMLSGIGPADHLRSLGLPVMVDSPEVGQNLRDHLISGHIVGTAGGSLSDATRPRELISYLARRRGMLTSNVAEAYGFVRSDPTLSLPDLEILFAPVAYVGEGLIPPPRHEVTVGAILLRPHSTGTVTLQSADPGDKARIDPRYLSDPDGHDRQTLLHGMRVCEQILATPSMRAITDGTYVAPGGSGDARSRRARPRHPQRLLPHVGPPHEQRPDGPGRLVRGGARPHRARSDWTPRGRRVGHAADRPGPHQRRLDRHRGEGGGADRHAHLNDADGHTARLHGGTAQLGHSGHDETTGPRRYPR